MDIIDKRINELHKETESLVNRRQSLINEINSIETRLTQIVGAMTELNNLKGENDEGRQDSESRVPQSTNETE